MADVTCAAWLSRERQTSGRQRRDALKGEVSAVFALTSMKVVNMMDECNVD